MRHIAVAWNDNETMRDGVVACELRVEPSVAMDVVECNWTERG